MPQIAIGTSLEVIARRLDINTDTKGAGSQVGTTQDRREVRHHAGAAYIKTGSSAFGSETARESRREGGRKLVLTGLRVSLQQLLPFGEQVNDSDVSTAQRFLALANINQKKNWATVGQIRTGVLYARQLAQLRDSVPGLSLTQGQALIEASGWPDADAATLKAAAGHMMMAGLPAAAAWKAANTVAAQDFEPAPAANPKQAVIDVVNEVGLTATRRNELVAYLDKTGYDYSKPDQLERVRGIARFMKAATLCDAQAADQQIQKGTLSPERLQAVKHYAVQDNPQ